MNLEAFVLRVPRGFASRVRLFFYRLLGMKMGRHNRMEGKGRCRRLSQIRLGHYNSFNQGCWLWPLDANFDGVRIRIGSHNYFNRNLMIDACGHVEIGDGNMFGPNVYITDSNHSHGDGVRPNQLPMDVGKVKIGNNCWIGAGVIILKDVDLGDGCVVGAGAVVTKGFPHGSVIAGVPAKPIR
jgi:maltose O-acetyltransferase